MIDLLQHNNLKNKNLVTKEVKFFWGKDYVISVGKSHWVVRQFFNELKENALLKNEVMSNSSDKLLYHILDRLLIDSHSIISKIGDEVELLNRDLFTKKSEKIIERISITRKNIILLNTINKPQLRLFQKFEAGVIKGFEAGDDMEDYWGNILDEYSKNWDLIEDYGELIAGLSTTFDSLQANKINEIMKVLTFFSSIMLPLTFITGLYGMNIGLPLQGQPYAFLVVVGVLLLIVLGLLAYFKKKNWI